MKGKKEKQGGGKYGQKEAEKKQEHVREEWERRRVK
jgi:hypothetical protein